MKSISSDDKLTLAASKMDDDDDDLSILKLYN